MSASPFSVSRSTSATTTEDMAPSSASARSLSPPTALDADDAAPHGRSAVAGRPIGRLRSLPIDAPLTTTPPPETDVGSAGARTPLSPRADDDAKTGRPRSASSVRRFFARLTSAASTAAASPAPGSAPDTVAVPTPVDTADYRKHSSFSAVQEERPDVNVPKKHASFSAAERSSSNPVFARRSDSPELASSPMSASFDRLVIGKHAPGMPSRVSNRSSSDVHVKETSSVTKEYDTEGRKMINSYVIVDELGRGIQGKVKRCYDATSADHRLYAMKIVKKKRKKTLGGSQEDPMQKIRREIAILKKCDHPNVVKLYEVIDDPTKDKVYLVLELVENGTVQWTDDGEPLLSEQEARVYFRDVLLGLEYLHYQGIVHRDIKPANLLLTNDNHVKISDFGVSYITQNSYEDGTALSKTAGSPAFFAPEMCSTEEDSDMPVRPISKMIDLWALGVTLYCFLYGRTPFWGENEWDLYKHIIHDPIAFRDDVLVSDPAKDLLLRLLEKDPDKRANFCDIKEHRWVTSDLPDPAAWIKATDPTKITVTETDMSKAFTFLSTIKRHLRRLSDTFRTAFQTRKGSVSSMDSSGSSPSTARPSSVTSPRIGPIGYSMAEDVEGERDIGTLMSIGNPSDEDLPLSPTAACTSSAASSSPAASSASSSTSHGASWSGGRLTASNPLRRSHSFNPEDDAARRPGGAGHRPAS